MASTCYGSIQACMLRWAAVNAAGVPQAGAENGYITDAIIQLGVGVELEEGADITQKNGCGAICQAFKAPDKIKRVTLNTTLCHLDAELIQLMVGGTVFVDGADAIGYELPTVDDPAADGGVLEVWSTAWDGDAQATDGANALYFHFVFPKATFAPGDFTLEEPNFLAFPLTGFGAANPNVGADGPYNDWPTAIESGGGVTASGGFFLDTELPTAVCGYTAVPNQAS